VFGMYHTTVTFALGSREGRGFCCLFVSVILLVSALSRGVGLHEQLPLKHLDWSELSAAQSPFETWHTRIDPLRPVFV
jgi:hypothetical protein